MFSTVCQLAGGMFLIMSFSPVRSVVMRVVGSSTGTNSTC